MNEPVDDEPLQDEELAAEGDLLAQARRELEPTRDDLERRRADVAQRLDELRLAVRHDLGWVPRTRTWLVPLVAVAGGLAAAMMVRRRRRRRRGAIPVGMPPVRRR